MTMPKFKYGDTAAISGAAIENGSFLVDTSASRMYVDIGDTRHPISGIEYINDTRSAAGANWTGISSDHALYDGKTILFRLAYASSSNTTLNLTLNNGTKTGAKNVFFNATTRLGTQYAATNVVMLTYVAANDAWYVANRYVDNNTTTYIGTAQGAIAGTGGVTANTPIVYVPVNNGYNTVAAGLAFSLAYPIYYTNTAYSANATVASTYLLWADALSARNIPALGSSYTGLTTNKPVYLVGTYANGLFTIDSSIFTCTPPTASDGKVYLLIGAARSNYQYTFFPERKLYKFYDGAFQEWTPSEPELPTSGTAGQYLQKTASGVQWATVAASDGIGVITSRAALSELWDNDTSVRGTTRLFAGLCSNLTDPKEIRLGHLYVAIFLPEAFTYTFTSHSYPQVLPTGLPPGEWREITDTYFGRERYDNDTEFANGKYYLDEETGIYTHESGDYHYIKIDNGSAFSGTWYLCDASITDAYDHQLHCNGEDHTLFITESPRQYLTEHSVVTGVEFIPIERHDPPWYAYGETTTTTITIKLLWGDVNPPCLCVTDSALSATSTNPVQNAIIQAALTALESRVAALEAGGSSSSSSSSSSSAPTTGTLTVTGVGFPSGAQWMVDGGTTWYNIGDTATLSPGNYTITYKAVSGYVTPTSQDATVSAGSTTTITANSYTQYGTLLVNYTGTAPSGAQWTHDGGTTWTNFGSSVTIVPGTYTVSYKTVNGYTAPSSTSATVTGGNTTTITAGTYTASASTFGLAVSGPNIPSGAQWSYNGGSTWNNFPGNVTLTPGTYTLTFKDVSGYVTPSPLTFTASTGDSIVYSDISYTQGGILSVYFGGTVPEGARWIVNGTEYGNTASVMLTPGSYTVTFKAVSGYTTPASQTATVNAGQTIQLSAEYVQVASANGYLVVNDKRNANIGMLNGIYTLYSGSETSSSSYNYGGSVWKHQTLPLYIYRMGDGTAYWYIGGNPGDGTDNGATKHKDGGAATSVFAGGSTTNSITITYVIGTPPAASTPHISVWDELSSHTYAGDYYLYSGTLGTVNTVWKKADGNYYLRKYDSGSEGGFWIWNSATGASNLVRVSGDYVTPPEQQYASLVHYSDYYIWYNANDQHADSINLTFPASYTNPMEGSTETIDAGYSGTYAYSGNNRLFYYVNVSTGLNTYLLSPIYTNGTAWLRHTGNAMGAGDSTNIAALMGDSPKFYSLAETAISELAGSTNWTDDSGFATIPVTGVYSSGS